MTGPASELPSVIVFDFDGTILDTETPVFEAWQETFIEFGAEPISFEMWVTSIGLSRRQFDPAAVLSERIGRTVDREAVDRNRQLLRSDKIDALPLRPGIETTIRAAADAGIALGVASSSSTAWVGMHLERRGLRDLFGAVVCAGDPLPDGSGTVPGKPDPTSYRLACEQVGADVTRGLAVEDSPHGISAANAAGLFTIAAPGPMTNKMNFSHADVVLADFGAVPPSTVFSPEFRAR